MLIFIQKLVFVQGFKTSKQLDFNDFVSFYFFWFWFWFCKPVIMGELEGGRSVAVAVGVSDN